MNAGVGLARALDFDRLQDQPVVVFLGSPDVRELAALRAEEPEPLEILGAVVRADIEPLGRAVRAAPGVAVAGNVALLPGFQIEE